jgi:hypothetical protein
MDKLILCMKWGTRYGAEYANRLYRSCRRHTAGGLQFICFTDDPNGLDAGIDARPLPAFPNVPAVLAFTPWRKISLWQRSLGDDLVGRDALVLDLDVVVTGPLDDFFTFEPGHYAVIENWTKKGRGIGNTSVFRFKVGKYPAIYDEFVADPLAIYPSQFRIEQEYISARIGPAEGGQGIGLAGGGQGATEQVYWPPAWCRSFKEELIPAWPLRFWQTPRLPADARIVVFHGKPDPDEALVGLWPTTAAWKKIYKAIRPVPWIGKNWR